ncbi:MetQ/NlpA family ABC transporter substrate-binding protein [Fructilactobacillus fructivorans]|uniref:Methionine ABC transporter substrate-binding protein n=1 Tax=Fructilactobacillus fructivorans TaxID=1614 RepID=A0A0C1Q3F0_9LACO|nr:MetQ/NlpA family ABC transporter substrate-binding protein [Fructilactobacillus fructivorans]KID42408.1 Methionine ABC transporter substrate-binding protein [Fructilactobacillus fructivorans]MCT0150978.1 metal ABC transporter substrate-binding protein [Fructilactobacillus fructivorans]MCT2867465.1 metal ABC transporter substrate-binding protein [Fructilactobacillus fructivorans]MCT2869017.1 metal ABC transporter substrate-binding protein [Fructilactobacillus fructivorans]MCT2873264.1 metal 
MKKRYWITALVAIIVVLFGYTFVYRPYQKAHQPQSNKKTIVLASSPGPYSDLFMKGIKPILEKDGYKVKNKSFSVLLNADMALNQGQVDLNIEQHGAYMNNFNKENHGDLVSLTKVPTIPTGIYPAKKHSLKDVKKGDTVAIPNDPSNMSRAFLVMEKAGWIKLKKGVDPIKATKNDIIDNKYDLKFDEMDSANEPRSRNSVDYAIIPGSDTYGAKIPASSMLLRENPQSQYMLLAVVNKKNEHTKWAQDVKKAYNSKQFMNYMKQHNQDHEWEIPEK